MAPGLLSLIIPAYNEAERIAPTLARIVEWVDLQAFEVEILVVDDGSTDATIDVASGVDSRIRVLANGMNRGKGYSVRHGVLESRGDQVLFSDADLSTPIEEYERLVSALEGADIAIGSRAVDRSKVTTRQPFYREAMGRTFNRIVQVLAVGGVRDTQCGFKLFDGDVARELFADVTIDGFAFDVEVLYLALRRGLRIKEVPVFWANDERTHVHAIYHSLSMLRDVALIRWRHARLPDRRS
jgi:dolichyl-phosphate beta-glucosyltransferase